MRFSASFVFELFVNPNDISHNSHQHVRLLQEKIRRDQMNDAIRCLRTMGRFSQLPDPSLAMQQLTNATSDYDHPPSVAKLFNVMNKMQDVSPDVIFWDVANQSFRCCSEGDEEGYIVYRKLVKMIRRMCCRLDGTVKRGKSISFDDGVTMWSVMLVRAGGSTCYPYLIIVDCNNMVADWNNPDWYPIFYKHKRARNRYVDWINLEGKYALEEID